ncbi:MAG: hypothetical protein ACRDGE_06755 [Candidatus Limnocylindria bacterium]
MSEIEWLALSAAMNRNTLTASRSPSRRRPLWLLRNAMAADGDDLVGLRISGLRNRSDFAAGWGSPPADYAAAWTRASRVRL